MASKFANGLATVSLVSCAVALPLTSLAAEAVDIEAATTIAADTKFKIELAAKCGTPIASHTNLRLERFAVALDLMTKGLGPQKLSQADFETVMTAVSTPESTTAIAKRAAEAAFTSSECQQSDNIKYWNFLREAGPTLGN